MKKIILCSLLSVGLVNSIIVLNLIFNQNYQQRLSQKLRMTSFDAMENEYNKKFDQNKKFGEFCYRLVGGELDKKQINLGSDGRIRGALYADNNIYKAEVDTRSAGLIFDHNPQNLQWKWYSWFGL